MTDDAAEVRQNEVPLLPLLVRDAWLAVPALRVIEVVDDANPLSLPRSPAHISGILNLRGTALPVLDVGRFLGLPSIVEGEVSSTGFPRIVVVEAAEMTVGLRVRSVLGVIPAGDRPIRQAGAHSGELAEIATGEIDLPGGIGTVIDLARLLGRARVHG